jgi:hypothetical protein
VDYPITIRSMKVILGIAICVLIFNTSCSQSPSERLLPGTYCFSAWGIRDSLFVNKDHTYRYEYYASDGKISKSSGKWSYDSLESQITFENFSFPNDKRNNLPPGYWVSRVRLTDKGEIHLMYSSEDNIYFSKK